MGQWKEIGRTEYLKDNSNPKFTKSFTINYKFEQKQFLRFLVLDIDKPHSTLISDQQEIGMMECTLGEIAGHRGQVLARPIVYQQDPSRKNGGISVRIEEYSTSTPEEWHFTFSCKSLEKKDFFGKSDPYLVISKMNKDQSWTAVHTTETYKKTLNPNFKPFHISSLKLCNNDKERPIRIECFDWNRYQTHSLIGLVDTKLSELKAGISLALMNPAYTNKQNYVNSGTLVLDAVMSVKEFSFLDYLAGGLEISLVVAIDFTGSNGKPHETTSLHYRDPNGNNLNDYQKAILSVGDILNYYDSDHKFPVYGFGGFINATKKTSHCFACNFNENNPEVNGVQEILGVYNHALNNIQLSGPTNFSEVIERVNSFAKGCQDDHYYVLLILTDGEITDMDKTIDSIISSSEYPMSIIIVGIGNEKFENMQILDGDDHALQSGSRVAKRDIVQFVPFRDFKNKDIYALAEEVLKEVPGQVCEFMKVRGYQPRQRIQQESFYGKSSGNLSGNNQHQNQQNQSFQQHQNDEILDPNVINLTISTPF
jgi:hypothetical protein